MKEPLSPESRLLVLSARTAIEPAVSNSISELVAGPLNWDKLISLAARNSITPLLDMHLRNAGSATVPPAVLERLGEMGRAVTAKNLLLTAELIKLASLFRAQDILAIP